VGSRAARGWTSALRPHAAASVAATMRKAMSAWLIESKKASASAQMLTCGMFVINARIPPKTKVSRPRFLASFGSKPEQEGRCHNYLLQRSGDTCHAFSSPVVQSIWVRLGTEHRG